jgi:putative thiamine transport system ATP-binding protein
MRAPMTDTSSVPPPVLQLQLRQLRAPSGLLLQDFALSLPAGAIHTVMGPSGSGKSSLLAALCGILEPGIVFAGQVWVDGTRVDAWPTQRRRVGLLLQDDLLFAHMTVRENLLFAVPSGPQAPRAQAVLQALAEVELLPWADADPATLSGGQRARAALARALLAQPRVLLLDEPFSKLDAPLRQRMRALVWGAVRRRGLAAVLVTHDAADVADAQRLSTLG